MRKFRSFDHSTCKTVMHVLDADLFETWENNSRERVAVVKFRVDNKGSDGTC